jgi:uncharacterized protein YfaQ (DUF2300 family)
MIVWIVQAVPLAVASKKEETVDQSNHGQKNLPGPSFLEGEWAMVMNERELLRRSAEEASVMALTSLLVATYLHQSHQQKKLYPAVKTSSSPAHFPAAPDSTRKISLEPEGV